MAKKYNGLHDTEVVEVVITKNIPYKEYLKIIESTKQRGWKIQAYKVGAFQNGLSEGINQ